jgi:hypothetical protein
MTKQIRILGVQPLEGTTVRLRLTNGEQRSLDLGPYLRGPVFEPIRESSELFCQVAVDPELGTIVWPNGADIDPDVLIQGLRPAWQEAATRAGA